jgi:hypothetical protein
MNRRIIPFMLVALAHGVVKETITLKGLTGTVTVTAQY